MHGCLELLAQAGTEEMRLTAGGMVIMSASIMLVLGLMLFCIVRILKEKHPEEHHHVPLDIDTHDLNQ